MNFVTLTGSFINGIGQPNSGSLLFQMSDVAWDTVDGWVGVIAPLGVSLNSSGAFSVSLLAMDNANISGNWSWKVTMQVDGITFPSRLIAVNFASGATQNLASVLATSKLA